MRFFGRKSNSQLLEEIIDRQQGPRTAKTSTKASKPRRRPLVKPTAWRSYAQLAIVLMACSVAGFVYLGKDSAALMRDYEGITSQAQISPREGSLTGRAVIVDADTIEIRGRRVRLWGVDAPESAQLCQRNGEAWRCGQAAALALADWVGERTAACEQKDIDQYQRIVGRCVIGGTDVSAWLVENGWAMAFRRYSLDYVAHEDRARRMRAGIWDSEFMPPWEWRAARRPLR